MLKNRFVTKLPFLVGVIAGIHSILFAAVSYAQEDAGKLAPLLEGLGDYTYPVSDCSASAQRYFDQGLRLVYAFQFAEAVASFREAARLDSDCPMTHWGEALAIAPNPNNRYLGMPDDPQGAGARAILRAAHLSERASAKERGLIDALRIVYDDSRSDRRSRDLAHIEAMRHLLVRFPEDPEIATLYGAALMTASPWDYWTPDGKPRPGTEEALAAFSRVLERHPDHPGANHLYIHLLEDSQFPERALPHAERLSRTMPGSGHLAHMPSHIYIVTGRYAEAIESNRRSHAADEALLAAWGDREIPMEAVSYTASATVHGVHAHDFLHMAAVLQGNYTAAMESARTVQSLSKSSIATSGAAARRYVRPWLTQKRFGKWKEILQEPSPEGAPPFVQGMWQYVRGSALAATGALSGAERALAKVRAAAAAPGMDELRARVNSARRLLTIAAHVLAGEIAAGRGEFETAIAHLETATRLEDGLLYIEPPDWGHPVRHSLGAVLLEAGRAEEAEVVYWEDLRRNPENGWSLHGVGQSLLRQGKDDRAAEVEKRFHKAWAHADVVLTNGRPATP